MHLIKHKNTRSQFVHDGLSDSNGDGTGWVAQATMAAATILNLALGKKPETESDIAKQQIQQQLAQMGYPQFSQMEGWGGDEDRKMQAMATIYTAIQQYPGAAGQIEAWLQNGQITPSTISQVQANYPVKSNSGTGLFSWGTQGSVTGNGSGTAGISTTTILYGVLGLGLVGAMITVLKDKPGK